MWGGMALIRYCRGCFCFSCSRVEGSLYNTHVVPGTLVSCLAWCWCALWWGMVALSLTSCVFFSSFFSFLFRKMFWRFFFDGFLRPSVFLLAVCSFLWALFIMFLVRTDFLGVYMLVVFGVRLLCSVSGTEALLADLRFEGFPGGICCSQWYT